MTIRDRAWLRSFLYLDSRVGTAVRRQDVERQEDTVLRALALLDEQPGVLLADEVGMGKTYEALGVLAARLHERPGARALILTPGPDLNEKWRKELRSFCDAERPLYRGFAGRFEATKSLAGLAALYEQRDIVVAPVSVFNSGRGQADLAYLLALWAEAHDLAGNQIAAIFKRYRDGELPRARPNDEQFLGTFDWRTVKPHVDAVLRAHKAQGDASLDAAWKASGYDAFNDKEGVDRALADLRFRLIGAMMPPFDLLVVDEAHKLKSSDSVRTTGVRTAFAQRFDRALFLTATPFQLSVGELRQVFALFSLARTAPPDLMDQADRLLASVGEYQQAYDQLDRVWALADGVVASDFAAWFAANPDLGSQPEDPVLRPIVAAAAHLLALKRDQVEPALRRWMIRSLREDKRQYRNSQRIRLRPQGDAGVPFLLYERFIAELFHVGTQTHKAAVQINMVSSYGAAREGALLADSGDKFSGDAEAYRRLLQLVVGTAGDDGGHPKVDHVVKDALAAVGRDEKTLIFCARLETLRELKRQIETAWEATVLDRWRRVYPGAPRDDVFEHRVGERTVDGHHSRLRDRFSRVQDALYLALRERYVATLLGGWTPTPDELSRLVASANAILVQQRVGRTQADRIDWSLAKRCIEQAAALIVREIDEAARDDVHEEALTNLLDPRFVPLGYDLEADDVEAYAEGSFTPTWRIDADDAALVLRHEHLWSTLKGPLHEVPPVLRVRTVERLASYLVARNVLFLPDLLWFARAEGVDLERIESRELLPVIDRFWTSPTGRPWCELMRRFLTYANSLDDGRRRDVLDDAVNAGHLVRHTADGESREQVREAFNTPLYPMVLVANEVMQEGLDLHHHCRRVVHHDLAWNPAQLEQRVGRVDRLGSLVQRLRERRAEVTLDVLLPLIANTIDERLERTVRLRERWLEFLLGAAPRIDEYGLADDPMLPLPEAFAAALRIDLGP